MTSERSAADDAQAIAMTRPAGRGAGSRGSRWALRGALAAAALLLLVPELGAAQTKRLPRPSPTPDPALEQIDKLSTTLGDVQKELAAIREDVAALSARLDTIDGTGGEIKGIAEPMREEVRGLYVESSNVRGEIARLEETYAVNTEALAKSRYVLTLLLVATALLQVVVLAVLLRSR